MSAIKNETIGTDHESYPLFRCPKCKAVGIIDWDQFNGTASIICATTDCDYHETKDWSSECQTQKGKRSSKALKELLQQ